MIWPARVEKRNSASAEEVAKQILQGRADLRSPFVTIDGEDAKGFR